MQDRIFSQLGKIFRNNKAVLLAYIFGSTAKNVSNPRDFDVAVLLAEGVAGMKKLRLMNEICSAVSPLVKRPVDVIILNDASAAIKQQVLKYGRLVFERKKGISSRFTVAAITEYIDYLQILNFFHSKTVRARR